MKAFFLVEREDSVHYVFGGGRREKVAEVCDLYPVVITPANIEEHYEQIRDAEVIFSTWSMPMWGKEEIARFPKLKAILYAAGSIRRFAVPFLESGVQVTTSGVANGTAVAEFTAAQIILANKGYFSNIQVSRSLQTRTNWPRTEYRGNFEEEIALLGVGQIGRKVISLLKPIGLHILVYDPFLKEEDAAALGVEKVSLEEAFSRGHVISNHIANLPETVGLYTADLFRRMRDTATFINTGRGAQVVEDDLIAELRRRPTLTALLDVTFPEPPLEDSPFYTLPNVFLSNHIAGSMNNEVWRMADDVIADYLRLEKGEPLRYAVTLQQLEHMA